MPTFDRSFKQSGVVRNGLHRLNVFALTEPSSRRLSFLRAKNCYKVGYQIVCMTVGHSHAIPKVGQAISMVGNGWNVVLGLQLVKKQGENFEC